MAKLAPITIPTKAIGSIPDPLILSRDLPQPAVRILGVAAPVDPILRPRKKGATVRSNPARIGAGARETVNF